MVCIHFELALFKHFKFINVFISIQISNLFFVLIERCLEVDIDCFPNARYVPHNRLDVLKVPEDIVLCFFEDLIEMCTSNCFDQLSGDLLWLDCSITRNVGVRQPLTFGFVFVPYDCNIIGNLELL